MERPPDSERSRRVPGVPSPGVVSELPVKAKVERLLKLAKGRKRGLILTHDNPDPDSMAAAVALCSLLHRRAGVECQVGYGGIIGRSENLAFAKVLHLPITPVSQVVFDEFDLLGLVDTQQGVGNHSLPANCTADIVIDHHPLRQEGLTAPYADVGGEYGATSTLLVEYLRAARLEPNRELATALYYGIKADTRDLGRQTTDKDVDAYLWLFERIDKEALAAIEHPDLPARYFQLFHTAIEKARVYETAIVTDLEEVYSPDMVAEVAERMMALEDMKYSLAFGSYKNQLFVSLRVKDRRMNAGRLIREICQDLGGSAGGHGSMAGARLPMSGTRQQRDAFKRELSRKFREAFGVQSERGGALLSAEPS